MSVAVWLPLIVASIGVGVPNPDPVRVKVDVDFLASPGLAGRETGTDGAEKAAAYVAQRMQETGLEPIRAGGFGGVTPFHFPWRYQIPYGAGLSEAWGGGMVSDVVGVVPGTDPVLSGEYVFVTAHFDHLGIDQGTWYPGADDNASGTAGLLEAMRLLHAAGPRRTIAFLGVSGEEEGLLGSEAFLAGSPIPLEAIKADINLDMIGRGRPGEVHLMPAKREGCVSTLTEAARDIALTHGINLSAGIEDYWQDSDHHSFVRRRIPSVCFNTGLHADYHEPSDTPDKINYARLTSIVKVVRDLALETANAGPPPAFLPAKVWKSWIWGPYATPNLVPAESAPGPEPGENSETWVLPHCVGFGM